mmetsp:Transcript_35753/g.75087  ORF Transcript_35753/g.75087 Transcript_35753/m.75087 type:complete len:236 (+) Transcript_35753:132-839(+)|eukprot:6208060-Pleurochrysis_carterae.AAC.4
MGHLTKAAVVARVIGVCLAAFGFAVQLIQQTIDFPNALVLLPPGLYLLLLTIEDYHTCFIRAIHLFVVGILAAVQILHFPYWSRAMEVCAHAPWLLCVRGAGHVLVAEVIGLLLCAGLWPGICQPPDALRRLWQVSRFGFAAIAINALWSEVVTLICVALGLGRIGIFPDSQLFGFVIYPSPEARDVAFLITDAVWLTSVIAVAPKQRQEYRRMLGLAATESRVRATPGPKATMV